MRVSVMLSNLRRFHLPLIGFTYPIRFVEIRIPAICTHTAFAKSSQARLSGKGNVGTEGREATQPLMLLA